MEQSTNAHQYVQSNLQYLKTVSKADNSTRKPCPGYISRTDSFINLMSKKHS